MPDALLKFVPEGNLKWLNGVSQKRWLKLIKRGILLDKGV
jgi:hypothetical protein